MNRLQKKCLIATAGLHLLLLVILFVGPGFFAAKPKPDDTKLLEVIPDNLINIALNSGVKSATPPPPPTPEVTPQPTPPPPVPAPVKPVTPEPTPVKVEPVKPEVKPDPEPAPKPVKIAPHPPQINLKLTERTVPKNSPKVAKPDDSDLKRALAIKSALRVLKNNFTPGTTVDMPGDSSAAYANYASVVKSIYTQAWTPPDDADNDEANARVSITIASDGTVISARMVTPSGDAKVDGSVQRTLNRVTFIAPFPSGTTDKQRTYIINFNLKAKRMLG